MCWVFRTSESLCVTLRQTRNRNHSSRQWWDHLNILKISDVSKVEEPLQTEVHHLNSPEQQPFLHSMTMLSLLSHVCHLGLHFQTCKRGTVIPTLIALLGYCKDNIDLNWCGVHTGEKSSYDKNKTLRTFGTVGIRKCWDVIIFVFCCCFALFYVVINWLWVKR